jgi:hypothetical protein
MEPPGFLVLSATLLLPLPAYPATPEKRRRLAHRLRDHYYNPQRYLDDGRREIRDLTAQKREWIARRPATRRQRRERFRVLRELTEQLRQPLKEETRELEEELSECDRQLQANAVLRWRDYAFCLYPESLLRPFCTQFLQ